MAGHQPWSKLRDKLPTARREKVATRVEALRLGLLISELRKQSGLTQQELAERLGISQPGLSQMESGDDMQVGTLRKIIHELGGEIVLHMPDCEVSLSKALSSA